jgi:signal transduction histidine kinase
MLGPDHRVERLAVFHQDPLRVRAALEFRRRHPITLDDPGGVGKVLRTGEPELLQTPADALADEAGASPGWRWMAGEFGLCSYLSVPLATRGQVIGALTLAYGESGRHYTQADLSTVEELARRAATSLDNARLYREAQEAVLLRDNFLSVASHELNTPITSIKLHVQGLQRTLRRLSPEVLGEAGVDSKFLTVDRQLSRLSGLVRELLDISRLTAGHLHLEPEELELTGLVREVMSRVHEDARRAGSTLLLDAPEALVGCWDRQRLDQVVTNLLSNAIKYGQGKPIRLLLRGAGDDARVVVADEGIGIAPEDQGRLFQRFERMVSHRHYSGWGLGLWIVKQLLDSMGATIEVRSQLGQGTVFTVLLPRSAQVQREPLAG